MVTIFNRKLLCRSTSQNDIDRVKKTLYKNAIEFIERAGRGKSKLWSNIFVLRRDWATALSLTNLSAQNRGRKGIVWAKRRKYPA